MKGKIINIIQKLTGLLAVIMFLTTFVVTVSINTRGSYWQIFGIGIALFIASIFATCKLPKVAGVFLFLVSGFWVYIIVDASLYYNGELFNNAISHANVSRPLGLIFTITYVSIMLIGLVCLTVLAFFKPKVKMLITAPLALFTPIVMAFFHVINYVASPLLYSFGEYEYAYFYDRYDIFQYLPQFETFEEVKLNLFTVLSIDIRSGRIFPILTFLLGFVFLAITLFIVNQTIKVKEKTSYSAESSELDEDAQKAVRSLPKMVVLSIVTFGIYRIIWIKKTTRFIGKYTSGSRRKDPTLTALLSVFVPGYYSYHAYQASLALQSKYENADKSINNMLPIISLVCPIITDLYIQNTVNNFVLGTDEAVKVDLDGMSKSPFKVLLLSAITGGIYSIFHINALSKRFENVGKTKLSPLAWGLLAFVFPPIAIWWSARMAKIIDTYYASEKCTPYVVASAVCPPLAYALIQDRINELSNS